MKVCVLTCGRSDYSIYFDLLNELNRDTFFEMDIIAFGTHDSKYHGKTIENILEDGFNVKHIVNSILLTDNEEDISTSMGLTILKFSKIWKENVYDTVIVLGDRYEMFSAVCSSTPFNQHITHLHGGEFTTGAIDDQFRDSITRFSNLHFVTTENHSKRVKQILGKNFDSVINVGAPALDTIQKIDNISKDDLYKHLGFDVEKEFILVTYHPETVELDSNEKYVKMLLDFFSTIDENIVITLPNNDTMGNSIRDIFIKASVSEKNIYTYESLGRVRYYSAIKYSNFVLGNSSSGIIEVASFGKYVINVGNRQGGRTRSNNTIDVDNLLELKKAYNFIKKNPVFQGTNKYWNGGATKKMIKALKKICQ